MRAAVFAVIALCFGVAAPGAAAQSTNIVVPAEAPSQLVERAERVWAESLVSKDIQQLTGVLDRRFRLITAGLQGYDDYDEYLQQQSHAARAYRGMTPTSISVSVNGDVAVAVVSMTVEWPEGLEQHRWRYWQFTDTWICVGSEWRAVNRVSQPVQAG